MRCTSAARENTVNATRASIITLACAVTIGCGGGGDGGVDLAEPTYTLARFEFARGHCQFDSERMREIAAAQYPAEYAQCNSTYVGNTYNGAPWPNAKSWPSTPMLS